MTRGVNPDKRKEKKKTEAFGIARILIKRQLLAFT